MVSNRQNRDKSNRLMDTTIERNAMNLYHLSNYEKGRLRLSKLFFILERKKLKAAIETMSLIVYGFDHIDCQLDIINHFIDENRGKIFPLNCDYCEVILSAEYSLKQYEIIALMNDLLFKLKKIVARTFINGSDLHELFCLLHAFHNLPRAFFSCSTKLCLSSSEALQYANDWIHRI